MKCRRRAAWTAGGISVAVAFLGCNFIVGVGDYAVGGGDAGVGGDGGAEERDATYSDVLQLDARSSDVSNVDARSPSEAAYYEDASYADASYVDATYVDASYADVSIVPDSAYVDVAYHDVRADQAADAESVADARLSDGAATGDAAIACGFTLPGSDDSAFQQLVKACTLAVSCDPEFFDENISNCITNDLFASSTFYQCLPAISTCADFFNCWGVGLPSRNDITAADNAGGALCNGQLAINGQTSGLGPLEYDCTILGGACSVFFDPDDLQTARCVVGTGKCADADYTVKCTGTSNYECLGGVPYGKDCSKFGGTCVSGTTGTGCLPPGTPCTSAPDASTFMSTCDGTTLVTCDTALGYSYPWDCAVAHEQCSAAQDLCVSQGCSATLSSAERCDSNTGKITVSIGGAPYVIDCTTFDVSDGFTTCTTNQDNSGTVFASCMTGTQ